MGNKNYCFGIGMIGIIITAAAQIGISMFYTEILVQKIFFFIYPIFIVLLMIGFVFMLRNEPYNNNNPPY